MKKTHILETDLKTINGESILGISILQQKLTKKF